MSRSTKISPKHLTWDDYFDADESLDWNQIMFLARKHAVPTEMRITLWCNLLKLNVYQQRDANVGKHQGKIIHKKTRVESQRKIITI